MTTLDRRLCQCIWPNILSDFTSLSLLFHKKNINIADYCSVTAIVCNYFYNFVVRSWQIQLRIMYNLNELAFEAMLEKIYVILSWTS